MVNLKEATEYFVANGYFIVVKNKYILQEQKLRKALSVEQSVAVIKSLELVKPVVLNVPVLYGDWVARYQQFIIDAKIPNKAEDSRGNLYSLNKYSEPGMKAFRKALEEGTDYKLLVLSTLTYYQSGIKLKKAVGNYMHEGLWRDDYFKLTVATETNTLKEHLKSELDDGQFSFTRLG